MLGSRFNSIRLKLLNPCSSHYTILKFKGMYESCLFETFKQDTGLSYPSWCLFLNQTFPHLSSLHTASLSASRRGSDNEWAPSARYLNIFEERQQGNVKCSDDGPFKGGWWMETSWHFKWQHLKGSRIFLKPRQEISVTGYWFGVYVSHLIQWLIWREAACMLGFHLVTLKAYSFWFILSSFAQGCFITNGWMTGFPVGCKDR